MATAQDVTAVIIDGRSMVPLRYVTESLGASVTYDSRTRNTNISLDDQHVNMSTGSNIAFVDGNRVVMDTTPALIDGVTYVPVRFVSTNLGMDVIWISQTRQVRIAYPKTGKTIVLVVREAGI